MQSQNKRSVLRLRTHAKSRGFQACQCYWHLCFLSGSVSFRPLAPTNFPVAGDGTCTQGLAAELKLRIWPFTFGLKSEFPKKKKTNLNAFLRLNMYRNSFKFNFHLPSVCGSLWRKRAALDGESWICRGLSVGVELLDSVLSGG